MDQAFILVAIACGEDLRKKIGDFAVFTRDLAVEMANGRPERFLELTDEFGTRYTDVAKAIRAEMGLLKKEK